MSCVSVFVICFLEHSPSHRRWFGVHDHNKLDRLWDWIDIFWVIWTALMILAGLILAPIPCCGSRVCESLISSFLSSICEWEAWEVEPGWIQVFTQKHPHEEDERRWGRVSGANVMVWSQTSHIPAASCHSFPGFHRCSGRFHWSCWDKGECPHFIRPPILPPSILQRLELLFQTHRKHTAPKNVNKTSPATSFPYGNEQACPLASDRQIVPAVHFLSSYSGPGEDQQ